MFIIYLYFFLLLHTASINLFNEFYLFIYLFIYINSQFIWFYNYVNFINIFYDNNYLKNYHKLLWYNSIQFTCIYMNKCDLYI